MIAKTKGPIVNKKTMLYKNPKSKKAKHGYLVEIDLDITEMNMWVVINGSQSEYLPHLYAINRGWILKSYLHEIELKNEFGPICP